MDASKERVAGWRQRRLTKSRFVRGARCARKLFYGARPEVYPEQPASEFLQALAEGGWR